MGKKFFLFIAGLLLVFACEAIAQYGPLTFRADISGNVWWYLDNKAIAPQKTVYIDIYADYDPTGQTTPRINWSTPFLITGVDDGANVVWGDTAFFPQAQFLSFWNVFSRTYAESWDGTLPDMFSFVGVGMAPLGYPSGLGEILILRLSLIVGTGCAGARGEICVEQGDAVNDIYDWLFDDPVPTFPTTCWPVVEPPCSWPLMDNCPSQLVIPAAQETLYDFNFYNPVGGSSFIRIVSGPGIIDSVFGIWTYTPPMSTSWDVQTLVVLPYDNCSCPRDTCRVPVYVRGVCGDANGDGIVNIQDITGCIFCLYKIVGCPTNPGMDSNGNGVVNVQDITYTINFLYKGGPAPHCPPWPAP